MTIEVFQSQRDLADSMPLVSESARITAVERLDRDRRSEVVRRLTQLADDTPLESLGDERAMVQVREYVVILRFPVAADRGLVVSLDVEAARDLHEFVLECTGRLEGAELSSRSSAVPA